MYTLCTSVHAIVRDSYQLVFALLFREITIAVCVYLRACFCVLHPQTDR